MRTEIAVLDAEGLRQFQALRSDAIHAVAERFCASLGGACERLGPRGRDACREDLGFHLEFLRPALEFGIVQPMADYLRWLASVLDTRGIPSTHIVLSIDWLSEFFAAAMEPVHAGIVVAALAGAKLRYGTGADPTSLVDAMLPPAWPECEAFESALLMGDYRGARSLLDRTFEQGHGLVDVEVHMIQPALVEIGRKWQNNLVTVAQEHLATAIALSVMNQALAACEAPPPNGLSVVLACVEGNNHSVGLQMVADAFQLSGWEVQYLGTNMPTSALVAHIQQQSPSLLGLSVSLPQQLCVVKDIMARLARSQGTLRTPVIVGGLAINQFDRLAGQLGADAWSPHAGAAVASGLHVAQQPEAV